MQALLPSSGPYLGLVPYTAEDSHLFFGRDIERQLIIANLHAARLTILYGASGVGKSSLLDAGVAKDLQQPGHAVVVFRTWHGDTLAAFKQAVVAQILGVQERTLDLAMPLEQLLRICAEGLTVPLMIVLDQFEDYFLYHAPTGTPDPFAAEFARSINSAQCPANFLIAIREEALARLDRFEGRIANLFNNFLRLEHLDGERAREAILGPITVYNQQLPPERQIMVEEGLPDEIIAQVQTGQVLIGPLGQGQISRQSSGAVPRAADVSIEAPYLQLVLKRLWAEDIDLERHVLRRSTLQALGGAQRIVFSHLDTTMSRLKPGQREVAARIFHYLVTPSGTKISHTVDDLANYAELPPQLVQPVLSKLSAPDLRILRSVASEIAYDSMRYEIFHDALAPAILDWRARYLNRSSISHRLTAATIALIVGSLAIQFAPGLPTLALTLTRALAFVLLHSMVVSLIYSWFSRYVRRIPGALNSTAYGDINLGAPLGALLGSLWLSATDWPRNIDPVNPLGTMRTDQFVSYLITIAVTLLWGIIIFSAVLLAGRLSYWFSKQFDIGFYVMYVAICLLIVSLIALALYGLIGNLVIVY